MSKKGFFCLKNVPRYVFCFCIHPFIHNDNQIQIDADDHLSTVRMTSDYNASHSIWHLSWLTHVEHPKTFSLK